ncbi:MAG: hypothetical protein DI537_39340 [Stutzerimonas stutzeri]|nr:MAG: hypothetical protein DI537_39340 [Stutzerimonas stutzeri]
MFSWAGPPDLWPEPTCPVGLVAVLWLQAGAVRSATTTKLRPRDFMGNSFWIWFLGLVDKA